MNALAIFRPYAVTVSNNAGVSPSNKTALGVNPKTSTPVPITTPTTAPALTAVSTSTAGTIIRYRDASASPSVKSKPYGVVQMQLFAAGKRDADHGSLVAAIGRNAHEIAGANCPGHRRRRQNGLLGRTMDHT